MGLRLACVNLPGFALQVLVRRNPDWVELPAAVVDRDEATGTILQVNRKAREAGIRAGLSFSQALSLSGALRAGVVPPEEIEAARRTVTERLFAFTPEVEPCDLDAGAFWLNAAGMEGLYPVMSEWMRAIVDALCREGLRAVVVVGWSRFASLLVARAKRRSMELPTPEAEHRAMRAAPLGVLPLSPATLLLLERLGIERVGDFLDLPARAVRRRFGMEAKVIFDRAKADLLPLQPLYPYARPRVTRRFDDSIRSLTLLLAEIGVLLDDLIDLVRERQRLVASITILLEEGGGEISQETITPAEPTRAAARFRRLIELRLASRHFGAGVERVEITAAEVGFAGVEGDLFNDGRARAEAAGARAIALIRARLGNDSVRRAVLRDEHLPMRSFAWEALDRPPLPAGEKEPIAGNVSVAGERQRVGPPVGVGRFRVIRRILRDPIAYAGETPPEIIAGPFVVSGRWWHGESERRYFFARSRRGAHYAGRVMWLYQEAESDRWMVEGVVD